MPDRYQPLYHWRRTKLDENDEPRDSDWSGYDGEIGIGRIQLQEHGPTKGKWHWAAHGPHVRHRHTPHTGYEAEGREAMRMVEEYYHALMAANGLKGSRQD
ncbi:hypothetical protein [Rhizobium sp. 2MFCol3.1]|uniref:hypothetical protein n=1 Tax=Rhizobium sp. 2MFCol3.1 TaxID=1246459 RepID=UPI00047804ED|nr:hypothetical protein [Rhizobium sp. 2MFCol3.1]